MALADLTDNQKSYLLSVIEKKKKSLTKQHGKENPEAYRNCMSAFDKLADEIKNSKQLILKNN